jgi:hypothetical protein
VVSYAYSEEIKVGSDSNRKALRKK